MCLVDVNLTQLQLPHVSNVMHVGLFIIMWLCASTVGIFSHNVV